jgi:hypothetical protein
MLAFHLACASVCQLSEAREFSRLAVFSQQADASSPVAEANLFPATPRILLSIRHGLFSLILSVLL